ncbi:UPF0652 protein [Pseudoscourfieldia marina]
MRMRQRMRLFGLVGGGGASSTTLRPEELRQCRFASPDSAELQLSINVGMNGARLSHNHARQYTYVRQTLYLWREIMGDMFRLWCLAEDDLLKRNMMIFWHRSAVPNTLSAYALTLASDRHARSTSSTTRISGLKMRGTCVYLSMNISAFGTLWSPRCTAELSTQPPPRRCMHRFRMPCIADDNFGAACTRFNPCPVSVSH